MSPINNVNARNDVERHNLFYINIRITNIRQQIKPLLELDLDVVCQTEKTMKNVCHTFKILLEMWNSTKSYFASFNIFFLFT